MNNFELIYSRKMRCSYTQNMKGKTDKCKAIEKKTVVNCNNQIIQRYHQYTFAYI